MREYESGRKPKPALRRMVKEAACQAGCCLSIILALSVAGCKSEKPAQEVVVYTSLDKVFSQPIFEAFEKETRIRVLPVYDSEATKTTGLVNRLIAEKGNPKADVFKNLRASDKFRLLFSSLHIPIDIPASFPELHKFAEQFNWIDAPQAITEIRNSLVHPEHKRRGKCGEVFYSVWNLSQWYLELALLRICDYSGTYSNRLIQRYVGQVETVPWDNTKVK